MSNTVNYILFDPIRRDYLLPLVYMRPVSEIRIGILTIREKWEYMLHTSCSFLTEEYLQEKYPLKTSSENILINGSILPDAEIIAAICQLKPNEALVKNECIIALYSKKNTIGKVKDFSPAREIEYTKELISIENSWDIFTKNGTAIILDFEMITKDRLSGEISPSNQVIGHHRIFIEEGAKVECAILNTTEGPIYIGKGAEIMEGAIVRGPFALCDHAVLKLGAKIYGPTTIGPFSKVGGEINNSVIFGYSNKAHDGFLGNAVLAEWCNIGADSNNSNLKNTYDEVRMWSYPDKTFVKTGLQFCGLIMGDHSKCGINTMFNTGTTIGVSSNVFGAGYQRNFVSSFVWGGGSRSYSEFKLNKAISVAKAVYSRRNMLFNEVEQNIMEAVYNQTYENRNL